MDDPFVRDYDPADLEIAAEFLTNWLPFLSRDLCAGCSASLRRRILSLRPVSPSPSDRIVRTGWGPIPDPLPETPKGRMSWADMAQEDELAEEEGEEEASKGRVSAEEEEEEDDGGKEEEKKKPELSREQREQIRFKNVTRKKDFVSLERVKGHPINILAGLELHKGIFSAAEQKRIVDFIYELQEKGRNGELGERTYSEPQKWMRGKGRVTIQFGCCYNYATDKEGNPPGILHNVISDPIPHLFKVIIRRLIRWHVLPTMCVPDSCIVNIYEPGDCIPPHIDSHDFVRPFCTVSFLSECNILFGSNLKIAGPGEFTGSVAIPLPVGSVLVLNGNGADVAKHCVPVVPTKRISITFRKMDEHKWPAGFVLEPDLQNILPLSYDSGTNESPPNNDTGKQPLVLNRKGNNRSFRGRRSRRTPAVNPDRSFQGSRPLHSLGTPAEIMPHRSTNGWPGVASNSMRREGDLVGNPTEIRSHPDTKATEWCQDDADELPKASTRGDQTEAGSGYMESKHYGGRGARMEQGQIIASHTRDKETGSSDRNRSSEPARTPRARGGTLDNRPRMRVNLSDDLAV